jgi:hypothetical protein
MQITKKWLIKKDATKDKACKEGIKWFEKQSTKDAKEIAILLLKDNHFDWAVWLVENIITKSQAVEWAIYSADLVLPIFEKEHPNDDRPRKAIETAKNWLKKPTKSNQHIAHNAADAAYFLDFTATHAAYSAAVSTDYAAANHASTAAIYAIDADAKFKKKIIMKGIEIVTRLPKRRNK